MPLATFLQKIPMVVLAIITALLAYQFALLTWVLLPETKPALIWKPLPTSGNQNSVKINTRQLQQQHLFGENFQKAEKPEKSTLPVQGTSLINAPKTRLKLKLTGVVAATEVQYSSAIIERKGSQGSYFVDSEIDGTNAIIIQIHQDRIILDVSGVYQTLMLDGIDGLDARNQMTQENRGKETIKKKVRTVNLDRKALLKNPGKLTDYIRISPVREDGQIRGYRVKPGKDRALFEQAGLKRGDLAVELNGIDLTDMKQAMTLMKEFPTMTEMSLSIERDGQLHELYFSIP